MNGVNKAIILGTLGRDPEIRRTNAGQVVVSLSVATSERWKDKNTGERREKTEWHRVTIWDQNLAQIAEQYLRKGTKVYLEGRIETRKWQDQSGQDRYSTEVVLRPFQSSLQMVGGGRGGDDAPRQEERREEPQRSTAHELEDDIPFD